MLEIGVTMDKRYVLFDCGPVKMLLTALEADRLIQSIMKARDEIRRRERKPRDISKERL